MVMPGSLDYLYYNGVLDHIPYYAYETIPYNQGQMTPAYASNQMMADQYLKTAKEGQAYNTYNHPDVFVKRNNDVSKGGYSIKDHAFNLNNGYGNNADFEVMANGEDGKSFREQILEAANSTKETVMQKPILKGVLAGGIILGTFAMLFKGKSSIAANSTGFWTKVNPINWFRKA